MFMLQSREEVGYTWISLISTLRDNKQTPSFISVTPSLRDVSELDAVPLIPRPMLQVRYVTSHGTVLNMTSTEFGLHLRRQTESHSLKTISRVFRITATTL